MSDAISLKNIFQFFPSTHTGSSESALFVQDSVDEIRQRFQESYELGMIGKGICDELNQVFTECQEKGWDGYQAKPISIRSYLNADRFLKALVPMIEAPSIGAEPDGQITVEWYRNPQWLLSISFDPESKIHYAAR